MEEGVTTIWRPNRANSDFLEAEECAEVGERHVILFFVFYFAVAVGNNLVDNK